MFKLIVMQVRGLMERLFMGRSLSAEQQLLLNAKPLRAKSTQASKVARKPRQPVKSKPKRKPKAAQPTSAVALRKAEPKPAPTTPGKRGRPRKIPV